MAKIDRPILLEIVRVVQTQGRVPDFVSVQKRRFSITYLEDHRQRLEEALRRQDSGQLNMLFGQLESKVKYQVVKQPRETPAEKSRPAAASRSTAKTKPRQVAAKKTAAKKAPRETARAARTASHGKSTAAKGRKVSSQSRPKKAKTTRSR